MAIKVTTATLRRGDALWTMLPGVARRGIDRWTRYLRPRCADTDPEVFFTPKNEARAKTICATCPLQTECLLFALRHHETVGVWGGTTEQERAILADELEHRHDRPLAA